MTRKNYEPTVLSQEDSDEIGSVDWLLKAPSVEQYSLRLQDFLLEMQKPPKVSPHYADFYTFCL